jgi:hypothetical protein
MLIPREKRQVDIMVVAPLYPLIEYSRVASWLNERQANYLPFTLFAYIHACVCLILSSSLNKRRRDNMTEPKKVNSNWTRNLGIVAIGSAIGWFSAVPLFEWYLGVPRTKLGHKLWGCSGGFVTRYIGTDNHEYRGLMCDECGEVIDKDRPPMRKPLSTALAPADAEVLFLRQMRHKGLPHDDNDESALAAFMRANGYPEGTTRQNLGILYSMIPGTLRTQEAAAVLGQRHRVEKA